MPRFIHIFTIICIFLPVALPVAAAETNVVSTSSYAYVDADYLRGHVIREQTDQSANLNRMQESWARMKQAAGEKENLLFLPGLVADREQGRVYIWGQATGMRVGSECEFLLIANTSGHGYESVAYALAQVGDIRKALEFIGLTAGRPVDYSRMQFWPKGERVVVRVHHAALEAKPEESRALHSTRIEDWLYEPAWNSPAAHEGFIFTGSHYVPDPAGTNRTVLAADAFSPRSIISSYNEPGTLLDVPRQAGQSATYGTLVYQPVDPLPQYYPMMFTLEPERPQGPKRVVNLTLRVGPPAKKKTKYQKLPYDLQDEAGNKLVESGRLKDVVAAFKEISKRDQDPYVSIHFDPALTMSQLVPLCQFIENLEGEGGLRVEGPPPGQLFYKAFLVNPNFRFRDKRPSQPWELRISAEGEEPSGTLTLVEEHWDDHTGFSYEEIPHPVSGAADLVKVIEGKTPRINTVFVYARPDTTSKTLHHFLGSYLKEFPIIYIFMDE